MTTSAKTYTIDEFMKMPDAHNGRLIELVRGEIEEKPTVGKRHSNIQYALVGQLLPFVKQNKMGYVYSGDADFVIFPTNPATVRKPDVAFLAKGRVADMDTDDAFPRPPDLAVEIWSPYDYAHPTKAREKITEYQDAHVPLIWVIDPRNACVQIYRPGTADPTIVGVEGELSGEDVVPGFTIKVSALFEVEE